MKRKVIAVWSISNTGSINVYEVNTNYIYAGINNEPEKAYKIQWTNPTNKEDGIEPYIKIGDETYYLSECLRVA